MSAGSRRKRTPRRQPAPGARGAGTPLRGDLGPAHRGYAYQDLATAFALAQSLVEPHSGITVDRKLVAGDKFDDISVRDARGFVRRQLKWSDAGTRALTLVDFVHADSALRGDLLVQSHVGLQPAPPANTACALRGRRVLAYVGLKSKSGVAPLAGAISLARVVLSVQP